MALRRRRSPSPGRPEKPERCVVAYRIGFSGNREYIAVRDERWRGEACANSGSTQKGAIFEARFPGMLDITKDIQSLTNFRRRSGDFMKQLRKSKRPVVLTVKGKAAAIVQDAAAYQRLLDVAASADAEEGIRQGLEEVAHGRTRPARDVFDEIRRKHDIPR